VRWSTRAQGFDLCSGNKIRTSKKSGGHLKFRISLFLLTLALAASSTMTANAAPCNNATIRGTYAFTIRGTILVPDGSTLLVSGVDKVTFDGNGNLSQLDAVAINGNVAPGWRLGKGTYSVNPNCTGSQTIVVEGMPDLHLQFIISRAGKVIRQVVTDQGFATTAEGERQRTP
jgi:hypothetical protein